ncbi:MAG: hypothetical protein ABJQ29_14525 [Luteolibacter sp.]
MGYSINPYAPIHLCNSTVFLENTGDLVAVGLSVTGTTESGWFEVPLFQTSYSARVGRLQWKDLYFPGNMAPVEYWVRNFDCINGPGGMMARLECLLYELNQLSGGTIQLISILMELSDSTGASNGSIMDWKTTEIELVPAAANAGHFVSYVNAHERELSVQISRWIGDESVEKESRTHILVEYLTFRPTPQRRLNKSQRLRWKHNNLSQALWEEFDRNGFESAASIFTPRGEEQLLGFFRWTKLSLMTNAEARVARIAHLQGQHVKSDDAGSIAASLIAAELYSPNTSLSQIKKQIPKLLSEAFPRTP